MSGVQMKIRLPAKLKERIEAAARVGNRSLNGEILSRLDESFKNEEGLNEKIDGLVVELEQLRDELRHQGMRIHSLETRGI